MCKDKGGKITFNWIERALVIAFITTVLGASVAAAGVALQTWKEVGVLGQAVASLTLSQDLVVAELKAEIATLQAATADRYPGVEARSDWREHAAEHRELVARMDALVMLLVEEKRKD